jgi:phospholipid N-methyltransferase
MAIKRKNFDSLCHTHQNPHVFSTFPLLNFSPKLRLRLRSGMAIKRKNFDSLCHTHQNPHVFSTFPLLNFSPKLRLRLRFRNNNDIPKILY